MALHKGSLAIFENNVGVSDAVLLDPISEDVFILNLKERFNHEQIYVSNSFINSFYFNLLPNIQRELVFMENGT